ncbi:MAG: TIGR00730 family Rossman fold protein [Candidatus Rifleibacteriota bacterium]
MLLMNIYSENQNNGLTVCVFCSSSADVSQEIKKSAAQMAGLLAKNGYNLLYGGTTCGLMKVVADAHKNAGGQLFGVIPEYMVERGIKHELLDKVYLAKDLRDRKQLMLDYSDVILVFPGGIGTYDEFFDLLAMKQLKRHNKPMFVFNLNNYFEPLLKMLQHGLAEKTIKPEHFELFEFAKTPNELIEKIKKQ